MAGRKGTKLFYVFYLGWKECRGLRGREFVEPIVRELVARRYNEELPKLTLDATRKELKITQSIEKKKNKVEKLKYPPIPTKDITYATQALNPDDDVVACIYLGYNPQTRAAVHVHVYRFDSPATASFFVDHLSSFIDLPEHQQRTAKIESELIAKGQVLPSPSPYGMAPSDLASNRFEPQNDIYDRRSYAGSENMRDPYQDHRDLRDIRDQRNVRDFRDTREDPYSLREFRRELNEARHSPRPDARHEPQSNYGHIGAAGRGGYAGHSEPRDYRDHRDHVDPYHEQEDVYQSVAAELKAKLKGRGGPAGTTPILLPAKDYDTVRRKGGNLEGIEERRSRNKQIVGPSGAEDDSRSRYSDKGNDNYPNNPYDDPYTGWRAPNPRDYRGRPHSPEPRGHPARAASPEPRDPYSGGGRRGRSPNRNQMDSRFARAMSPPPGHELRNNYFPNDNVLPNYLAPPSNGGYGGYPGRAISPARRSPRQVSPPRSRYGGPEEGPRRQQNPKYTASNLGLKHGGPPPRGNEYGGRPRSDEGYLSMDRNNPRGYNDPYDDPYGRGPLRNTDSPPPREVIAGETPHRELGQEMDPNLPGSSQPFLY